MAVVKSKTGRINKQVGVENVAVNASSTSGALPAVRCAKCGHVWVKRVEKPAKCPVCQSRRVVG